MTTIEKIEQWAIDRNLHTQDPKVQMCKTMEELGELAKAVNKGNKEGQNRWYRRHSCNTDMHCYAAWVKDR